MRPPTAGPRLGALLVATACLSLLFPALVAAHAELRSVTPPDGATVVGPPPELSATFSEALLDQSTLSIRNSGGDRLAVGGVDPNDPARLIIDPVPDLAPGTYEMRWSAFTDDGHLEKGTWTITVEAPVSAAPTPAVTDPPSGRPTEAPTASPTTSAAPTPSASGDDGSPTAATGDVILPIVAALAIVAGAALLLGRRGRSGPPA